MKLPTFCVVGILGSLLVGSGAAVAGTVISTNLPPGTSLVNISATADGSAAYSGDGPQSLWYRPTATAPALTLSAGTYRFRVINPADAAVLFPGLTVPQLGQIYTGWTFNSPWSENSLAFRNTAAANPAEPQLFDGALDPAVTLFGPAAGVFRDGGQRLL